MEVFRAHNEKCRALSGISLAPGTVIRYETSLRLTEEFLQKNYQKEDCYLDEVTNQFIEDFEFFLKTVGGAVRYNEEKVNRGRAEVLFWNRMLDPFDTAGRMSRAEVLFWNRMLDPFDTAGRMSHERCMASFDPFCWPIPMNNSSMPKR